MSARVRELMHDDAPSVAAIHLEAFPGTRASILGHEFLTRFYRKQFALDQVICLGLELEGKIVGFVCGGPHGYESVLMRRTFVSAVRAVIRRPWIVRRLLGRNARMQSGRLAASGSRIEGEPPAVTRSTLRPPTFRLRVLATDTGARRNGHAARLMLEFERRAAEAGVRSMVLSVSPDNIAARRFYVKQAMSPVVSGRDPSAISYAKCFDLNPRRVEESPRRTF